MADSALARSFAPVKAYLQASQAPIQSAALTLPLLLIYGLGVLLVPEAGNGVDIISIALSAALSHLGNDRLLGYLGFYGALALADIGLIVWVSRQNKLSVRYFWPLLAESSVYALGIGMLASSLTSDVTHFLSGPSLSTADDGGRQFGLVAGIIVSAGAGLHEELVFRLLGIAGVARMWLGTEWRRLSWGLVAILLGTSVLFSAVHHLVEPFTLQAFVFRCFAGLLFGSLFLARGFAVAAWTHALYDVWIIVILGR